MKLTIIGSGTSVMRKERRATSLLLDLNGTLLLFDCGWGCGANLLESGYNLQNLDHILVSHPHADHMGNLISLLHSIHNSGIFYPATKRSKPLYLHGYPRFSRDYEMLRSIMFPERVECYPIKVHEWATAQHTFGDISIRSCEVPHVPEFFRAVAYRVDYMGKSFVYSGDCGYNQPLVDLAAKADVLVCEMSVSPSRLTREGPRPNHLSPGECGKIASEADAGALILVHGYDDDPPHIIKESVRQHYKGRLVLGQDLQQLNF